MRADVKQQSTERGMGVILRGVLLLLLASTPVVLLPGCAPRLARPTVLFTPYAEERVWAVAPFANESGVSLVDGNLIADRFVAEIEGVDGLRALPLNRTLAAMERRGMDSIRSREDAALLLADLRADGIVLGSVTDWDPYKPFRFGVAVELVTPATDPRAGRSAIDEVVMATSGQAAGGAGTDLGVSQASRLLDARNHDVLAELERYSAARHDPDGPLGSRAYEMRIDLFTRFGAYLVVRDLLEQEAARLGVALPGGSAERAPDDRK